MPCYIFCNIRCGLVLLAQLNGLPPKPDHVHQQRAAVRSHLALVISKEEQPGAPACWLGKTELLQQVVAAADSRSHAELSSEDVSRIKETHLDGLLATPPRPFTSADMLALARVLGADIQVFSPLAAPDISQPHTFRGAARDDCAPVQIARVPASLQAGGALTHWAVLTPAPVQSRRKRAAPAAAVPDGSPGTSTKRPRSAGAAEDGGVSASKAQGEGKGGV
jgi:hypothetical protein